jgi:hypothetical protein
MDGLGFDVSGVDIIEHVERRRVNFFTLSFHSASISAGGYVQVH